MTTGALIRNLALALAALALPAAASAQEAGSDHPDGAERIDQVRQAARAHVGPVYLTPTILLKELGVDSNVFNAAGERKSDFTFTLGPRLDMWLPVAQRALLKATAGSDLVWYSRYDSERSVNPQLSTRGDVYLQRLTLFGEVDYVSTRERMNYEIDARARRVQNNHRIGAGLRLTPRFSLELATRLDRARFAEGTEFNGVSLQQTLNHKTTGFSAAARHELTPFTTLVMRIERGQDAFEFAPVRNSRSIRVMPGVEFKPRALVSGTAFVGYRQFKPSAAGPLPEFSGVIAQLGLSYTLRNSTVFGVSYSRDLSYSYEELQPFFVNNSIGGSVRRALGDRFDVLVSVDRHAYEYKDLVTASPALAGQERIDTTWAWTGNLGYQLGRARLGFAASYWQRDSRVRSASSYDNLRFGTTVTYGF